VLQLPTHALGKSSVSLADSGYHVLRGNDSRSFCTFRCGSILDRFSQIDMLHLDLWWRGENVLADPGSYLYNGPAVWHNHFVRTESHNTVQIDGHDQMPHVRQFKTLYRTQAVLRHFEDNPEWAICDGEHYGYVRSERCVHRRAVLFLKEDELWVIVDTISGEGSRRARLHWLGGDYPYEFDRANAQLRLRTPQGPFSIAVLNGTGVPSETVEVVCGADDPPRGWLSRYYGEKTPVPSLAATESSPLPITFVTLACPGNPAAKVSGDEWTVAINDKIHRFRIDAGSFADVTATLVAEHRL
jgi:hypothetical protein